MTKKMCDHRKRDWVLKGDCMVCRYDPDNKVGSKKPGDYNGGSGDNEELIGLVLLYLCLALFNICVLQPFAIVP